MGPPSVPPNWFAFENLTLDREEIPRVQVGVAQKLEKVPVSLLPPPLVVALKNPPALLNSDE